MSLNSCVGNSMGTKQVFSVADAAKNWIVHVPTLGSIGHRAENNAARLRLVSKLIASHL